MPNAPTRRRVPASPLELIVHGSDERPWLGTGVEHEGEVPRLKTAIDAVPKRHADVGESREIWK